MAFHTLPALIFSDIMMMVGLESLNNLHRCRQVCKTWNELILQVIRRYKLEFCHLFKRDSVFNPENFKQRLELSLASMLLRLLSMTSDDDEVKRNEERSHQWWVELGCEVKGARRLMEDRSWCLASGLGRDEDRDILPVMGFHAPFTCQLDIEKIATIERS